MAEETKDPDKQSPAQDGRHVDRLFIESMMNFQERDLAHRKLKTWIWAIAIVLSPTLYSLTAYTFLGPKGIHGDYISRIDFIGDIAESGDISEKKYLPAIKRAFEDKKTKGVVLYINSGGGSPVQASDIHNYILRQKAKHPDLPVIAVANDLMASGAYMIGTAADKIYANGSSIVGSIGVRMGGWAWDPTIIGSKYGIERRVKTAGINKDSFDPFAPERPRDVKKAKTILDILHKQFIDIVLASRSSKLVGPKDKLFDGSFWTGNEAVKLGIIDGIKDYDQVLTDLKVEQAQDYTPSESIFGSLKKGLGASVAGVIIDAVKKIETKSRIHFD